MTPGAPPRPCLHGYSQQASNPLESTWDWADNVPSRPWEVGPMSLLAEATHPGREPRDLLRLASPGSRSCYCLSPPPAPRPLPRPLPCPLPGHSCRGCRPQLPREPPGGSPALACPSHRLGRPSVAGDRPSRLCSACHLTPETQLARHRHAQPLIYETARSPRSIHGHRGPSSEGAGMRRSTHSSFTPLPKSRWLNSCLPFSHKPGNGSERLPVTWLHP